MAKGDTSRRLSTAARAWINSLTSDEGQMDATEELTPAQAKAWRAVYAQEQRTERRGRIGRTQRGPGVGRPAVAEAWRCGRNMLKARNSLAELQDRDGTVVRDPKRMEELLWQNRKQVWATVPGRADAEGPILDAYV